MSASTEPDRPPSLEALRAAAEWLDRLDDAGDPATRAAFERWRCADPTHAAAYARVAAVWTHSAALSSPPREAPPRARRPLALAAVVALVAVGGLSWLAVRGPSSLAPVATAAAERRDLRLPDGSTVSVGARSRVEVALDARERRVVLDYGEAYFQVAHDAARPFRVVADRYTVEAVGTSFNVRALVGDVRITVTSGIVRVRSPGADVLEVRAGEQYVANATQRAVHAVDAAAITAWRDGWLRFRDERLDYIVADLSRYAERRIEIADAPTAARRYTGAIRADAIDEWLVALPRALPLDVERPDARTVVLRARAEDAVAP